MSSNYIKCTLYILLQKKVECVRSFSSVLRLRRNLHWHYKHASFDSLLSCTGFGHLGKGWIVEDCLTGLTGSSIRAGTSCTDLRLIGNTVANCQALTWLRYASHSNNRLGNRCPHWKVLNFSTLLPKNSVNNRISQFVKQLFKHFFALLYRLFHLKVTNCYFKVTCCYFKVTSCYFKVTSCYFKVTKCYLTA